MESFFFSLACRPSRDRFPWELVWPGSWTSWTKQIARLPDLNNLCRTGWSRRAIEFDGLVKIMILLGGFGSHSEALMIAFILPDDIVIKILPSTVVHVLYRGQTCIFFHLIFYFYVIISNNRIHISLPSVLYFWKGESKEERGCVEKWCDLKEIDCLDGIL